jgi:hypothetical protein
MLTQTLRAGCGGTTITGNDITTEKAWSSGGGGVSMYYQVPSWQVRSRIVHVHAGRLPGLLLALRLVLKRSIRV